MDLKDRGRRDVLTATKMHEIYYYEGNADGTFRAGRRLTHPDGTVLTIPGAEQVAVADWDGDGTLDLIGGGNEGLFFLRGRGDATFEKPVELKIAGQKFKPSKGPYATPHVVDWDGDGTLDLLMGELMGGVIFFKGIPQPAGMPQKLEPGVWLVPSLPDRDQDWNMLADDKTLALDNARSGQWIRTSATDWNGDGKLDLLVGDVCYVKKPFKQTPEEQKKLEELKAELAKLQRMTEKRTEEDLKKTLSLSQEIKKLGPKMSSHGFVWVYLHK